ncbi:hypothetical protein [Streptomyces sp. MMG1121]|uniref:hypothetical protein n=1 Tax=Streptomyces sp. MMG1121 TaxID=1415544 RepID=UPI0006AD88D3|nr:hypothetical protein [Streptomyces sp. MMG1121]KOV63534.1 hypothetical protein ADK64_20865 [Streptomyces sp. MMG1121]
MDSTGEPTDVMDARRARDALAAACAAKAAARKAGARDRPFGYAIGQGLTFAAGFIALGLSDRMPRYGIWLVLAGLASLAGFFALIWFGAHHGGVTGWFDRNRGPGRPAWYAWVVPLVPTALGLLAWIPYGVAGWLVTFGVASGADYVLRGIRWRLGGTA